MLCVLMILLRSSKKRHSSQLRPCALYMLTSRRYQDMLDRRIPAVAFRRVVRSQECDRGRRDAGNRVIHAGQCF